MKWFGKKAISGLTKVIRGKSGAARGKQAVRKGILNARNPGARGSDYVKKSVNTAPAGGSGWKKTAAYGGAAIAGGGLIGNSFNRTKQTDSGDKINVIIQRTSIRGNKQYGRR